MAQLKSDSTVGGSNILLDVANSVDATNIAANAVGSSEIASDAVGSSEIVANAVGSSEIAANAVGSSELADNAVDTAAIANSAVTDAKISGMSSSKLSGALPAIDGSALTGISPGLTLGAEQWTSWTSISHDVPINIARHLAGHAGMAVVPAGCVITRSQGNSGSSSNQIRVAYKTLG